MNLLLHPAHLKGVVTVPASKSILHRALICAALADGVSTIQNVYFSEDIEATMDGLTRLGATFEINGDTVTVYGIQTLPQTAKLNCGESGSTIRFLIPIAAALGVRTVFDGRGRLITRPLGLYQHTLGTHGAFFQYNGFLPCSIGGKLRGGEFTIAGNVSSQFITGLLFALPLLSEESILKVIEPFESKSYVRITCEVLRAFGIVIEELPDSRSYRIPPNQRYQPRDYAVESDSSQAAFFLAANALGHEIALQHFYPESIQGDHRVFDLVGCSGLAVSFENGAVTTVQTETRPLTATVSDIPDLVPALAVLASGMNGKTVFKKVARLALKESDRIATTLDLINRLGGEATYHPQEDELWVIGKRVFHGGEADAHNDHRIAMAAAMAAASADGDVLLKDAGSVKKSYPTFWETYQALGGKFDVLNLE